MDKIQLRIFNSNIKLQKLVKYGLDIVKTTNNLTHNSTHNSTHHTTHNIDITILEPNITNKCDISIINLLYKDIINNPNILNDLNIMLEENFKEFNNFIVIVIHDDYFNINEIENIQTKHNIDVTHIYLEKAVEYLSVVRDDIKTVDTNIIDNILKDELGKQKYRLLDSNEKKIKQITNLIKNTDVVEEWMSSVGFDKLLDVFENKIIIPYNDIIQTHCKTSMDEIISKINYISSNNISITTQEQITTIIDIIETSLNALHIFNIHEPNISNTDNIDNINDLDKNYYQKMKFQI